jgi:hypothetical protein
LRDEFEYWCVVASYPSFEAKRLVTFPRSESPRSQNLPDSPPEIDLEPLVPRHFEKMWMQSHLVQQGGVEIGHVMRVPEVSARVQAAYDSWAANRPERLWGGETNDASPPKQNAKRKAVSK